jgi:hypothetical protein
VHTNTARWDRVVRIGLGLALLSLTVFGPQTLWGLGGVIVLGTGIFGFCPLYHLLGISTCAVPTEDNRSLGIR